jgi:hypothetical protein
MWRQPPVYRRPIHYFTDDARQLVILFDYLVPLAVEPNHLIDFTAIFRFAHAPKASRRLPRPSFT